MRSFKRTLAALGLSLVAVAGTTVAVAGPAHAATCYGGAVQKSGTASSTKSLGPFYASTRCADINMKLNATPSSGLNACVYFYATGKCNSTKSFSNLNWKVIASSVKDGTKFDVRVWGNENPFSYNVSIAY